jgi:hypothetical protein
MIYLLWGTFSSSQSVKDQIVNPCKSYTTSNSIPLPDDIPISIVGPVIFGVSEVIPVLLRHADNLSRWALGGEKEILVTLKFFEKIELRSLDTSTY